MPEKTTVDTRQGIRKSQHPRSSDRGFLIHLWWIIRRSKAKHLRRRITSSAFNSRTKSATIPAYARGSVTQLFFDLCAHQCHDLSWAWYFYFTDKSAAARGKILSIFLFCGGSVEYSIFSLANF